MKLLAFLIYALFVTYASLRPIDSASLGNWDKIGHLTLYFIFALLAYRVAANQKTYFYLCLGIVIYSGLMEVAQSFMPGRMMSAYDLLANAVGVAVAIIFTRMTLRDHNS